MAPSFLAQFAAGCLLAVAVSAIHQTGWKYLRLMAAVCLGLTFLAFLLLVLGPTGLESNRVPLLGLSTSLVFTIAWLFMNAKQGENVATTQRIFPLLAGLAAMASAVVLAQRVDPLLPAHLVPISTTAHAISIAATTILGGLLLGSVTAGMLLGHRYLTDTDMIIAPLRHIARIYLGAVIARVVWVTGASIPLWRAAGPQSFDAVWFWVVLTVRMGLGLIVVSVFAYMTWDCVRRRATQSATALFYLSMLFVFLGELAGQYLVRTQSIPM